MRREVNNGARELLTSCAHMSDDGRSYFIVLLIWNVERACARLCWLNRRRKKKRPLYSEFMFGAAAKAAAAPAPASHLRKPENKFKMKQRSGKGNNTNNSNSTSIEHAQYDNKICNLIT